MVLLHISACKGIPSEMVMKTLQLGIAVLRGGNLDIQMVNIIDNHNEFFFQYSNFYLSYILVIIKTILVKYLMFNNKIILW